MGADTFAPDRAPRGERTTQRFGRIVIVGGGCYGSYYVRQLLRAERAKALAWREIIVVDRDAGCRVAELAAAERPSGMQIERAEWSDWFARYLGAAAAAPHAHAGDAIVPSPLMPHLMAEWLLARARARWPHRAVYSAPLAVPPRVPWQRAGPEGTHYVSFAEWVCPINCIEPARCPHTRGARSWSLPPAIASYANEERLAGREVGGPFIFHCAHRAFGVGMLDVPPVLDADRAIAERAAAGAADFLVGTASHCHGALQRIVIDG